MVMMEVILRLVERTKADGQGYALSIQCTQYLRL
jgi:hypothetical protein